MLFNSFAFFIFFPIVIVAYFCLPFRFRNVFLLLASYFFYMQWRWEYGILIAVQTLLNYYCGWKIGTSDRPAVRKGYLALALVLSLGILGYYKYFNFFNASVAEMFRLLGLNYLIPHLDIILPVGISFFTFQTLSYSIDVYRRQCEVETSLVRFALFVSFFPQLVAGPIERASHLLGQFRRQNRFDADRLLTGTQLIIWGLFKKVVIADRLAVYVDAMYGDVSGSSGASLLLATYFFAFQIYCDFSGYSDIAIGAARILGYDLMQNFNLPYLSARISEFWKRWHISLSSWFADYVYIPLGGNRVSKIKWGRNILTVFLLSGLWHGANWTFVIWGALHAGYYFVEAATRRLIPAFRWVKIFQILITFNLVVFAWIFFRAESVTDAWSVIDKIFNHFGRLHTGASQTALLLSLGLILFLCIMQILQYLNLASNYLSRSRFPGWLRLGGYVGLLVLVALLGMGNSQFIYFQF